MWSWKVCAFYPYIWTFLTDSKCSVYLQFRNATDDEEQTSVSTVDAIEDGDTAPSSDGELDSSGSSDESSTSTSVSTKLDETKLPRIEENLVRVPIRPAAVAVAPEDDWFAKLMPGSMPMFDIELLDYDEFDCQVYCISSADFNLNRGT